MKTERKLPYYRHQLMAVFAQHSNTVRGVIDTASSPDKVRALADGLTGQSAAEMAVRNIDQAICLAWKEVGNHFLPEGLEKTIHAIADTVNQGILRPGMRFRQGADSVSHPEYGPVAQLPRLFTVFVWELSARMFALRPGLWPSAWTSEPRAECRDMLVAAAAFCEWKINMTDHYYADGCGKTSKIVAAYILMHGRLPVPAYPSYRGYYDLAPKERTPPRLRADDNPRYQTFLSHYRQWVENAE